MKKATEMKYCKLVDLSKFLEKDNMTFSNWLFFEKALKMVIKRSIFIFNFFSRIICSITWMEFMIFKICICDVLGGKDTQSISWDAFVFSIFFEFNELVISSITLVNAQFVYSKLSCICAVKLSDFSALLFEKITSNLFFLYTIFTHKFLRKP